VTREIDLVEEVARHQGFASIPSTLPASPGTVPARDPLAVRRERLRDVCASAGFLEAVSYSFIDEPSDRAWRYRGEVEETAPVIVNPLVQHQRVMRGSLVPGLLQAASRNQARGEATLRLFEFGKRFWTAGEGPAEEWSAAFLLQGDPPGSVSWQSARAAVDFYDMKGALLQILEAGGVSGATCRSQEFPFLHPAESAGLSLGEVLLGPLGRLHPDLEKTHDLEGPVYVAELDLGPLLRAEIDREGVAPPSRFPWADRDLSLLLPSEITYDQVVASIRSLGQEALSDIRALDRYSGKGVPDGRISLTVRLRYQRTDRTLEAEEASALTDAVVQCLCKDLGAELRS
jgi:phenylalanyl-tRNA synthetase beta chain